LHLCADGAYAYFAGAARFFEAIWNVVDWVDVERRFQAARGADLAIA